jgi:phosphinothricin acetyltransferase
VTGVADAIAIRSATAADAAAVARIYNHYVRQTTVTFEEVDVRDADIARRIQDVQSASLPWLVAERGGAVMGYAYASKWHARSAYRFAVEVTVYVDVAHPRSGVGTRLYAELFPILQAKGIHVLLAAIALPNEPSIGLHERFGFAKAGRFREVGFKLDRWVDVGYWQRTL